MRKPWTKTPSCRPSVTIPLWCALRMFGGLLLWLACQTANAGNAAAASPFAAAEAATPSSAAAAQAEGKPTPAFEKMPDGNIKFGEFLLMPQAREIQFPARINMDRGPLEVLIATEIGRLHESVLRTEASPFQLQTLLYLLGLNNGPRLPNQAGQQGDLVDIFLEWRTPDDDTVARAPVEEWVIDTRNGQTMARRGWVFVGSSVQDGVFIAETTGNLVLLFSIGDTILDTVDPDSDDDTLYIMNDKKQPGKDTAVTVIITPRKAEKKHDGSFQD